MNLANNFARLLDAAKRADQAFSAGEISADEWATHSNAFSDFVDGNTGEIEHALRVVEQLRAEIAATADFPSSFRDRLVAILGET